MGILDSLTGQAGAGGSGKQSMLISALMAILASQGGISGLIQKFNSSGLGDIVNSWVSPGANKSLTPQQVQQGLGQDTIDQLAAQTGMGHEDIKSHLSQVLPQVVDRLTPNGQVPHQNDLVSKGMDMLKGLF